ncbi:MAG: hypothetical protein VKK05_03095 [Synechococcus sp.]|nr:hypothetical protein [Synechococcus sp.]
MDFLASLDKNEVVCFIDAYDVIQLRPLDEMEELFKSMAKISNKGLVVGCEQITSTSNIISSLLYFGRCQRNKILNAGTYVGYVHAIQALLQYGMQFENSSDDQVNMIKYCKQQPSSFHVDCDNVFFLTIVGTDVDINQKNMMVSRNGIMYNGLKPFFLHGASNTNMNKVIARLGYTMSDADEKRIHAHMIRNRFKKYIYYAKQKLWLYIVFAVLGILLMILISRTLA